MFYKKLLAAVLAKDPQASNVYTPDFSTLWLRLTYKNGNIIDVIKNQTTGQYSMRVIFQPAPEKGQQEKNPVLKACIDITEAEGKQIYDTYFSQDDQEAECDAMALKISGGKEVLAKAIREFEGETQE